MFSTLYLSRFSIDRDDPAYGQSYLSDLPVIQRLESFSFEKNITFFCGENGTGKSTLLEALAVRYGFNPEGGSKNFNFHSRDTHSALYQFIRLTRGLVLPEDNYFLRAESFYNVASEIENLETQEYGGGGLYNSYGGISLHAQSHGESFLALIQNRFRGRGLYILDEPEAALSASRQMTLLSLIHNLAEGGSQFIIATHSPILLACPDADIHVLSPDGGLARTPYKETEPYLLTKMFLEDPERMLHYLLN
ncbi:AAA family ATPase [Eubacterium sp. 1001713B170207_170306_E7]|uniref:AAA family ATPase n=1 Tax=Eubacterium sp. 1001713B170207_170306_E7 TaxID=2787097 RepID=UPI00189993EF|nr:AAA family ATPase [Eubacterium sp. 1001713B170207_170306_E7]